MDVIRNSFLFHILGKLLQAYEASATKGFFVRCSELYAVSFCKSKLDHWLSKSSRVSSSLYSGMLSKLHALYLALGSKVYLKWEVSKVRQLCLAIWSRLEALIRGSFILRPLLRLDAVKFILLCLSLYFPIDNFLRKILQISALASVWDETLMLFSIMVILATYAKQGAVLHASSVRQSQPSAKVTPIDSALIFFIAVSIFLMLLTTDYPAIAFDGCRAVIQYMLWFFIVIRLLRDETDIKVFLYGLCASAVLIGLHGIYQYVIGVQIPAEWVTQSEVGVRTRVFSIIGSPNVMGSFLIMTAPMVLSISYYAKNIWVKLLCIFGTGCMCLSLLFTFSRGAWLGFALTVVIFALLIDKRLIALMAAGGTALLFLAPSIANRITFLFTSDFAEASAVGGRALRWEFGRQLLAESPVFGVGLGRFGGAVAMQNQILDKTDTFEYFYMDNYYLKTAVEMGYVGLIAFLILLVSLCIWALRSTHRLQGDPMSLLMKGAFSGMVGVLLHSYYENIFEVPAMNTYFWVIAAVIIYAGFFHKKRTPQT